MAQLLEQFDASTISPLEDGFGLIPKGKYPAQLIASEIRVTKDGTGQYLQVEGEITDGEYKGRKFWERFHVKNRNPEAVVIGKRMLSSLCHAVGKMQVQDSEELHFLPFTADVRIKTGKDEFGDSNTVRFLPPAAGTVKASVGSMPWKNSQTKPAANA